MKTLLSLIFIFNAYVLTCQDVEGIPFDLTWIDFNDFNKSELKRLGIKEINAFELKQSLENLGSSIDTVFKYHCSFNGEISEVNEKTILSNNALDFTQYKYVNDSTYFKYSHYLVGDVPGPYGENEIKTIYCIKNNKVSNITNYFKRDSSDWILKSKDSLYYDSNKLIKVVEFWHSVNNPSLYDSLLTYYKYDTTGKLVRKNKIISPTFFKNIKLQPGQFQTIAHTYNKEVIYNYGGALDSLKSNLGIGKFLELKPKTREMNFGLFYLREDFYKDEYSEYFLRYNYAEGNIAMKYNDLKKVMFEKNSTLPSKIIILTDTNIHVIFFTYRYD